MPEVTLDVRTEPYHQDFEMGITFYSVTVIGEVKSGNEILHTEEKVADDDKPDTVRRAKEDMAILIETWAVENTDFMPAHHAA